MAGALLAPQPTSHTAAQASTSMALNHTTPTDRSATGRSPSGSTAAASSAATGRTAPPTRPSSASDATVRRRCPTSRRATSRPGAATAARSPANSASPTRASHVTPPSSTGSSSAAYQGSTDGSATRHPRRGPRVIRVEGGHDQPGRRELGADEGVGQLAHRGSRARFGTRERRLQRGRPGGAQSGAGRGPGAAAADQPAQGAGAADPAQRRARLLLDPGAGEGGVAQPARPGGLRRPARDAEEARERIQLARRRAGPGERLGA